MDCSKMINMSILTKLLSVAYVVDKGYKKSYK